MFSTEFVAGCSIAIPLAVSFYIRHFQLNNNRILRWCYSALVMTLILTVWFSVDSKNLSSQSEMVHVSLISRVFSSVLTLSFLAVTVTLTRDRNFRNNIRFILNLLSLTLLVLYANYLWFIPIAWFAITILTRNYVFDSKSYLFTQLTGILLLGLSILCFGLNGYLKIDDLKKVSFSGNTDISLYWAFGLLGTSFCIHQISLIVNLVSKQLEEVPFVFLLVSLIANLGLVFVAKTLNSLAFSELNFLNPIAISFIIGCLVFFSLRSIFATNIRELFVFLMGIQTLMVLTGLLQFNQLGIKGALIQISVAAIAGTGLGICGMLFENRIGKGCFEKSGVAFDKMPRIATMFFFFGIAMVDFPGTLGFIGEDLLVHSILDNSTILAFVVLLGMAAASIAVYRSYTNLFLGKKLRSNEIIVDLIPREAIALASIAVILVGLTLFPNAIIF